MSDKVKRKYVKHDHEERVMAIKKVFEEGWSIRAAARLNNVNHRQVSFWLSTYEKYGNLCPVRKYGSYSADFKRKVVSDIVRNSLTLQQAALKYGLPCASAVRTWRERYYKYGDAGYIVKMSSVRKPDMSEKKKDRNKTGNVAELTSLRKEVEYLRAENAYLKKLQALVMERNARPTGPTLNWQVQN